MTATQPSSRYTQKLNYSVLVERQAENHWSAIALGGLDRKVEAPTREQALEALHRSIQERFANGEVTQLEVQ